MDHQPHNHEPHPSDASFHATHPSYEQVHESHIRCSKCGYDLTGVALGSQCPECGEPVNTSLNKGSAGVSGAAVASLIFGVLAFPGCLCQGIPSFILGGLAIVFFYVARKEIREQRADASSSWTLAVAGLVCGLVALALSVLAWLILLLFFVIGSVSP